MINLEITEKELEMIKTSLAETMRNSKAHINENRMSRYIYQKVYDEAKALIKKLGEVKVK